VRGVSPFAPGHGCEGGWGDVGFAAQRTDRPECRDRWHAHRDRCRPAVPTLLSCACGDGGLQGRSGDLIVMHTPRFFPRPWLVILALVLGAGTAVGGAWAFAWADPQPATNVGYGKRRATEAQPDPFPLKWYVYFTADRGWRCKRLLADTGPEVTVGEARRFEALASDSASLRALRRHAFLLNGRDGTFVDFTVSEYGWPLVCLASERAFTQNDASLHRIIVIDFPDDPQEAYAPDTRNILHERYWAWECRGHALPLSPIWGGLVACTAFYSIPWFLLLLAASRALRRSRPDTCRVCGYELVGLPTSAVCPECGGARS
jgi:hypothetical protein